MRNVRTIKRILKECVFFEFFELVEYMFNTKYSQGSKLGCNRWLEWSCWLHTHDTGLIVKHPCLMLDSASLLGSLALIGPVASESSD